MLSKFFKGLVLLLTLTVFVLVASSTTRASGMPTFDGANLRQNIASYLLRVQGIIKTLQSIRSQMQLVANLGKQQAIDSEKNATAMVKSLSEVIVQTTNMEIAAQFDSLDNACDVHQEVNLIHSASSSHQAYTKDKSKQQIIDKTTSRTSNQQSKMLKQKINSYKLNTEDLITPSRFMGVGGTYSEAEVKASEDFVDLITGAYKAEPAPNEISEKSTARDKKARADYVAKTMKKQIVVDVFNSIRSDNLPTVETETGEKISHQESIHRFIDSRFGGEGSEDFLGRITNSHPDKSEDDSKATSQNEVIRELAVMQSYSLYLDKLMYQEQKVQSQLLAISALETMSN